MCVAKLLSLLLSLYLSFSLSLLLLLHTVNPHTKFHQTLTSDSFQIYVKWTSNNVEFQYLSNKVCSGGYFSTDASVGNGHYRGTLKSGIAYYWGENGEKNNTCPNFHFFSTGVKTAWEHSWPSCYMVATIIMATDLNQHFKRTTKHNFAICQATLSASLHDRITSANRVS